MPRLVPRMGSSPKTAFSVQGDRNPAAAACRGPCRRRTNGSRGSAESGSRAAADSHHAGNQ